MNEAQKYLLNNELDDLRLKGAMKVENWVYVSDVMERYAKGVKKLTIPFVVLQGEQLQALEELKEWCYDNANESNDERVYEIIDRL